MTTSNNALALVGYAGAARILGCTRQGARWLAQHDSAWPAVVATYEGGDLFHRAAVEQYASARTANG